MRASLNRPPSPIMSRNYTLRHLLKGSQEAINCLTFSPNGRVLLSGGDDDCLRVWDLTTSHCVQTLRSENWAQITTIEWLHRDLSPEGYTDWISIGTGKGSHTLCPKAIEGTKLAWNEAATSFPFDVNDPVEAQAYDNLNGRLAMASHSGGIKLFKLRRKSLILLWEAGTRTDIPRSLQFFGPGKRYLLTSYLEGGEIICQNAEDSTIEWRRLLLGGIGNTIISPGGDMLLVDNLSTSNFDIYRFPVGAFHTSFSSRSNERVIKGAVFAEGGKFAVCGSDRRFAQIIDLSTHERCQELVSENPSDMLQTVAAVSIGDHRHLIACGSSSNEPGIYVWEKTEYGFDGRASLSMQASLTPSNTSRSSKLFNTLLASLIHSVPILLWITYPFWSSYFWQSVHILGSHVAGAAQALVNVSRDQNTASTETATVAQVFSKASEASTDSISQSSSLQLVSSRVANSISTIDLYHNM